MSGKSQRPPQDKSWTWVTLDLVSSREWRSLSINARRFIDFLMIEHMTHKGAANGYLLAPRRQLEQAGIGAQYVSGAIEEAERARLVEVKRGLGKRPSTYKLTWLPTGAPPKHPRTPTGSVATYDRKSYSNPMTYDRKSIPSAMTYKRKSPDAYKGKSQGSSDLQTEVTNPFSSTYKGKHLSRSSYREGSSTVPSGGEPDAGHVSGAGPVPIDDVPEHEADGRAMR